ncbi:MAG: FAD-dependent oxidoreductase [Lachnospiraceae bacterium]|nr:FAD-dependent oxidoreductase [Lachnospiraceae bacterium]
MKAVLSPCKIGSCEIKNRFVMTAANLGWCTDGYVTKKVIAFYRQRAKGQVGLIIAGAAGVDPYRINQVGMMQIYDDKFLPSMKRLVMEVHKEGSKIFLQLMHAGAYARPEEHNGVEAVGPSKYFCKFTRSEIQELSKEEIKEITGYFRDGALRAKAAGFDGIELIGSAGYLISEFLSKATNHRVDEYGGSIENRARFLLEILKEIRKAVGKDYPVIVRLSGSEFIKEKNDPEDFLKIGKLLEEEADALDITGGWHESPVPQITYNVPEGMYLYFAKAMKQKVDIPVIGCNRMNVSIAEKAVERGDCDFAGMLRSLIAEPFLVKKYMAGKTDQIRPCLSCNQKCLDQIFSGKELACAVNPFAGKETAKKKTRENQKLLVIGAGISGMAYALLMADTNHVTVWEQEMTCGGTALAVKNIPNQEAVGAYIDYLYQQCILKEVHFCWKKKADTKQIKQFLLEGTYDRVIIAAGSRQKSFVENRLLAGCEIEPGSHMINSEECLKMKKLSGRQIVILGGSYKAVQTALYCKEALKTGDEEQAFLKRYAPEYVTFANNMMDWEESTVTLLSPDRQAGRGFGKSTRWMMLKEIKEKGVTVETDVSVKQILKDRIIYRAGEEEKSIPADLVVLSEGWEKNQEFHFDETDPLEKELADRITVIGDAKRPGRISEAVNDAFGAAMI